MKTDVMTIAALVFCVGVLATSVSAMDVFQSEPEPVTALQQGFAIK